MNSSVVIPIKDGEGVPSTAEKNGNDGGVSSKAEKDENSFRSCLLRLVSILLGNKRSVCDGRRVIHSIKVGTALVLVSLLYLLNPLYKQVGENAMWAIMTVVVIFEFYAGATLSKGLNRGLGTILGGGLGCVAAVLAQEIGRIGSRAVLIGSLVFIFGAAATYARLSPRIKKRYDYGAMIFILTFNLVAVSGLRSGEVLQIARQRLLTIVMGFVICIFTSLLVCPNWASDELHVSLASKFEDIARSMEGFCVEYFMVADEKDNHGANGRSTNYCKSVLHSKSKEESLANFARWEPWHGKFGLSHPWEKYLQVGELLRELAVAVISLRVCARPSRQPTTHLRQLIKEPCETAVSSLAQTLRELRESIAKMKKCHPGALILPKLKPIRQELSLLMSGTSKFKNLEVSGEEPPALTFLFLLQDMVEKVEELAKEVEELGELAGFS